MCIIQPLKRRKPTISNNMNEPARLYAKWNKPDQERQILHGITDMWNLLKKKKKTERKQKMNSSKQRVEWWLPQAGVGEMGRRW